MRHLISIRRHVPIDQFDPYHAGWDTVRSAVEAAGGRAWRFRAAGSEDRFLEFIEWTDARPSPLWEAAVTDALKMVAELAVTSHQDEWEEAT